MDTHVLAETDTNKCDSNKCYRVYLANSHQELVEAQRFRYRIFAEEMGASLAGGDSGLDADRFDKFCEHVLVRLNGELVGYTRVLTCTQASHAGGFYSQTEFDMENILSQPGRFMEIGRTCIHPDHRNGTTISLLWAGLARFMLDRDIDYLMGCVSIPVDSPGITTETIMSRLKESHFGPDTMRVYPRISLPQSGSLSEEGLPLPPLLKGYLRAGAKICGEPFWDKEFGVADLFVLLNRSDLNRRYARHFVERTLKAA